MYKFFSNAGIWTRNRTHIFNLTFLFILFLSLCCSCTQENIAPSMQETESPPLPYTPAPGTRSNPYQLGDEITLTERTYDGHIVNYTITFSEFWDWNKVKQEYGNWTINDIVMVRGSMSVSCDTTTDEILLGLNPKYITDTFSEEWASFDLYKGDGSLDSMMYIYSGGVYDFTIRSMNDGVSSMKIPYLKLDFNNADWEADRVWIALSDHSDIL